MVPQGGADGVVKLWRHRSVGNDGGEGEGSTSSIGSGCGGSGRSYVSEELAALGGHPEEVYALEFVSRSCGTPSPATEGAAAPQLQRQHRAAAEDEEAAEREAGLAGSGGAPAGAGGASAEWLVAGSGESLFLWDVASRKLVAEATPPSARGNSRGDGRGGGPGGGEGGGGGEGAAAEGFPPYVFSLAVQRLGGDGGGGGGGNGLLATACCDGGVRLWQLGAGSLSLVGEAEVGAARRGSMDRPEPGTQCILHPWKAYPAVRHLSACGCSQESMPSG
jgi:hypothetical protein